MEKAFPRRLVILSLGVINALTPFTIDLYLPAFGDIARDLHTTVAQVSLSVATYFLGYALGQLIYGPLLDRFGRKPPIFLGLFIYLIATVGCMTAQSIEAMLIFRFLAALGGSAASVGAVTMVRDYFDPKEGARVFSILMLVLSVSPLFAPTLGGWIAEVWGWRSVFAILTALALIDVLIVWLLPPAHLGDASRKLNPKALAIGYIDVLKVKNFRVFAFAGAFSFAGLFVYLTGSSSIFIEGFGLSKQQYGYVFALLACALIGGGQINNLLLKKYTSAKVFVSSAILQSVVSFIFLAVVLASQPGLIVTLLFLFLILGCVGIGYPNAATLALMPFSRNIGTASSVLGFLQMGLGAVLSSLVGLVAVGGILATALVIAVSSAVAMILLLRGATHERAGL